MAKRKASPYVPGVRSDDWRKIKNPNWKAGRTLRPRVSLSSRARLALL
jgi:ATP-dependent DNA ligase